MSKLDLHDLFRTFIASTKSLVFNLQASEQTQFDFSKINSYSSDESIIDIELFKYDPENLSAYSREYKTYIRQCVLASLIEDVAILFKQYTVYLKIIESDGNPIKFDKLSSAISRSLTTSNGIKRTITELEQYLGTNVNNDFSIFLTAFYEMRNSIIHHKSISMKKNITIRYKRFVIFTQNKKGDRFYLEKNHTNVPLNEIHPDLAEEKSLGLYQTEEYNTIELNHKELIHISYCKTFEIINYILREVRSIESKFAEKISQLLSSKQSD